MLEKGTIVFGNWTVEEEIGSGAFGTVYKIKREEFGRVYYSAMKVLRIPQDKEEHKRLRSEGMDDASISTYYSQVVQDFVSEIELLSSLDGITNIVDYKDHIIEPNDNMGYTIYIKMQLLTPLNKMLINEDNKAVFMAEKEIIDLGIDICSALEICEKYKIIHRDIKVDNIFVSSNGDYKLGDFGIAKQLEATQGEMSKKGTMMYMAPEVFKGENYNHTVDIYSLGIVMYRLFNKNRAPFFPQYPNPIKFSDKETANAQRLNGAELPAIPGLNKKLMAVLRIACAFKAEDRYQTAAEFKKALKEIKKSGDFLNQSSDVVEQPLQQEEIINNADEKTESVFSTVVETSNDVKFEVVFEEKTESVFGGFSSFDSVPAVETVAEPVNEDEFEETVSVFDEVPSSVSENEIKTRTKEDVEKPSNTSETSQFKNIVETTTNSNRELNTGKKKSRKKWVIPVVIVLVLSIIVGVLLMVFTCRCYSCGGFVLPGTLCGLCDSYTEDEEYIDDEGYVDGGESVYEYEYTDGTYAYSNNLPENITYEDEGYYVTWYEDNYCEYLYDGISGYTYDELIQHHGEELEGYDVTPGIDSVGAYSVTEDENLCISFYQYRWVL